MYNSNQAYNDLPLLPPGADVETKSILKRWGLARSALAELRLAGPLIPDSSVLVAAIPLLEAKDSSEIENIVTTNDALFREATLDDSHGDPAAKEAVRYREALYYGVESIKTRPLSARTAIEICKRITNIDTEIRSVPVSLRNRHTGEVIYTPPQDPERLRNLLSNWEKYLHDATDIDPLIRMAVLHYQFEAIHPFEDGNGRTGRILNILCLMQADLLDMPTLYLSRHILRNRADYYGFLERVTRHGDWEPWIIYMLTAVQETSSWTTRKIRAIRALMDDTSRHIRENAPNAYSRDLVDLIFTLPYCRIVNITDRNIAKRQTASGYLKDLTRIGVMREEKSGREKVYMHKKYFDLLTSDHHTFDPYPAPKGGGAQQ